MPRTSVRAAPRPEYSEPVAEAPPGPPGAVVPDALRAESGRPPGPGVQQAGAQVAGHGCLSVRLLAAAPEAGLRRVHRSATSRASARRLRLLLHVVLQRVARLPEPLLGAEEGRHRLHAADAPPRAEHRALLRRLPGRYARLARSRPSCLVRIRLQAQAEVRGSGRGDRPLGGVDGYS